MTTHYAAFRCVGSKIGSEQFTSVIENLAEYCRHGPAGEPDKAAAVAQGLCQIVTSGQGQKVADVIGTIATP